MVYGVVRYRQGWREDLNWDLGACLLRRRRRGWSGYHVGEVAG